jgi:allophanate hydrolase
LGTDTAGSGRVPAAYQGIVGLKGSIGLVPVDGVIPSCRSFDCVSLMAGTLAGAATALALVADPCDDPRTLAAPLAPAGRPRLATFATDALDLLSPAYRAALDRSLTALEEVAEITVVDPEPFLAAGALLYDGAFVAERYAAIGASVDAHSATVDPTVATIIASARAISATAYVAHNELLASYRAAARAALEGCDGLVLPTCCRRHPSNRASPTSKPHRLSATARSAAMSPSATSSTCVP